MRLVCDPGGEEVELASDVETADSFLEHTRGLMFRRSFPADAALVFRFDDVATRDVHTAFVFFAIDVVWLVEGRVRRIERFAPFTGYGREEADTIVEFPAGGADALSVGDRVELEE